MKSMPGQGAMAGTHRSPVFSPQWWQSRSVILLLSSVCLVGCLKTASAANPDGGNRCGLYALVIALQALDGEGTPVIWTEVEKHLSPIPTEGSSLDELAMAARRLGFVADVRHTSLSELRGLKGPYACVILLDNSHFVLLASLVRDDLLVVDFPVQFRMADSELEARWNGAALLVSNRELLLPSRGTGSRWWIAGGATLLLVAGLMVASRGWPRGRGTGSGGRSGNGSGAGNRMAQAVLLQFLFAFMPADRLIAAQTVAEDARPAPVPDQQRVQARLGTSQPVIDAGTFRRGQQPAEVEFVIENYGPDPLEVAEVVKSCNCAGVTLSCMKAGRGEKIRVKMELDLRAVGEHGATVAIRTNSQSTPTIQFEASWTVSAGLVAEHPVPEIIRLLPLEPEILEIPLRKVDDWDLPADWFRGITVYPENWIGAELAGLENDTLLLRLSIGGFPQGLAPSGSGAVIVHGPERQELINLPIRWNLLPLVEIRPSSVLLDSGIAAASRVTRRMIVRCNNGEKLELGAIRAIGLGDVQISQRRISDGLIELAVDLPPTDPVRISQADRRLDVEVLNPKPMVLSARFEMTD